MSKIDLLVCRNVLIYFNPDAQAAILTRFHFALKNTGFLFLGKAETLINRKQIFTPIDLKYRIYTKGAKLGLEDHLSISPQFRKKQMALSPVETYFWQAAFETSLFPQLVVDANGHLVSANEQANLLFELTLDDWNQPFRDIAPGKLIEPFVPFSTFYRQRHPILLKQIEWTTPKSTMYFDISIQPIFNSGEQLLGINLVFIDVSERKQLAKRLENSNEELVRMNETLRATESALNAARGELASTQIELDAVHQEIQFINQGFQHRN